MNSIDNFLRGESDVGEIVLITSEPKNPRDKTSKRQIKHINFGTENGFLKVREIFIQRHGREVVMSTFGFSTEAQS